MRAAALQPQTLVEAYNHLRTVDSWPLNDLAIGDLAMTLYGEIFRLREFENVVLGDSGTLRRISRRDEFPGAEARLADDATGRRRVFLGDEVLDSPTDCWLLMPAGWTTGWYVAEPDASGEAAHCFDFLMLDPSRTARVILRGGERVTLDDPGSRSSRAAAE